MPPSKNKRPAKKGFKGFYARFPNTKLPLQLAHGDQNGYSLKNKPLSPEMAFDFIWQEGDDPFTEYTEVVPCFRLPDTKDYYSIVFWRGDMMDYHFYIATFDKTGEIINKSVIAGTKVNGDLLEVLVTNIENSWNIKIQSGTLSIQETDLSKTVLKKDKKLSIDPSTGKISIHKFI